MAENIKRIREMMAGLTQEQMAKILGVSQSTIARYEAAPEKISEDVENKLAQLRTMLGDSEQLSIIKKILQTPAGLAVIAGILTLGSVLFSKKIIEMYGFSGISSILKSSAGKEFLELLKKYHK